MNHTPGPWSARCNQWSRWEILGSAPVGVLASVSQPHDPSSPPSLWPECEANARLIAAAPDLLAALRDLHDDIQGRIDDGAKFNPGTLTALRYAKEALAKSSC